MKLLFLDIDGVLNDHARYPNGYCPIREELVGHLNLILGAVPDLRLVLSSAWRYAFSTAYLAEQTLLRCGANCYGRFHGVTALDPIPDNAPPYTDKAWWDAQGHLWRVGQINAYVAEHQPSRWAVLDDLPLAVDHLFLCEPDVGLTAEIAEAVVRHFQEGAPS